MAWRLERGANPTGDGGVTFSVWAPRRTELAVRLLGPEGGTRAELPMRRSDDGVFTVRVDGPAATVGADYVYVSPEVGARPDPVSRHQPSGVHGPSRVVAADAFPWTDGGWRGIGPGPMIVYELHVGTFTPEGTFAGVASRLPYLRELGVTAIELMPVAAFPGARNWGYDGVYPYAPHDAYGGPDGLKALVDACHAHGLALILDVVYNHLGPEGNYVNDYGPYFSDRYRTPWGDAINYDGADSDEVRRFVVDNALYWLSEYHVDGLRLDAIHGIFDFGARHVLEELTTSAAALSEETGRRSWIVAESDLNDPRVIRPAGASGLGFDAQWSDDFHHALHAVLTGARLGYFSDFGRVEQLARAFTDGYVYEGQYAPHRRRRHGAPAGDLPGERFVVCIQNHDQIANGYQGRRLVQVAGPDRQRVGAALLFSCPAVPMLFQGEEHAEDAPFDYFTSHTDPALAEAVRLGRHAEYLHLLQEGADASAWGDPQDEATFLRSKLRWDAIRQGPRAEMLAFYRALIALRRSHPALGNNRRDLTRVAHDEAGRWIAVRRDDPGGAVAVTCANLGDGPAEVRAPGGLDGLVVALATRPEAADAAASGTPEGPLRLPPASAVIFINRR